MTTHRPLFLREKLILAIICLFVYLLCLRLNCDGAAFNGEADVLTRPRMGVAPFSA